jgi:hypothetical protein
LPVHAHGEYDGIEDGGLPVALERFGEQPSEFGEDRWKTTFRQGVELVRLNRARQHVAWPRRYALPEEWKVASTKVVYESGLIVMAGVS